MTWFAATDASLFLPERFPVFTRRRDGVDLFGVPSVDGCTVKVSLADGYGEVDDPDALDLRVPEEMLGTIVSAVRELLPGLVPEPVRVSAYMDAFTAGHRAVVGEAPDVPHAVLLCGFSGHGFKLAPVVGEVAADLVMHGETTVVPPGLRWGA
jgi:sarcosine oxidase